MLKGQVSLDLMLAIIAAVVFFGALVTYFDGLSSNVQHASAQNELKAVLLDVYAATGSVKAYGVEIEYTAPQPKGLQLKDCSVYVKIDDMDGKIEVSSSATETLRYERLNLEGVGICNAAGTAPIQNFKCGEKVTIKRACT